MKTQIEESSNWPERDGQSLFSSLLAKPTTLGKEPEAWNFLPTTPDNSVEYYMEQYAQVIKPEPVRRYSAYPRCEVCHGRDPNCPVVRY